MIYACLTGSDFFKGCHFFCKFAQEITFNYVGVEKASLWNVHL